MLSAVEASRSHCSHDGILPHARCFDCAQHDGVAGVFVLLLAQHRALKPIGLGEFLEHFVGAVYLLQERQAALAAQAMQRMEARLMADAQLQQQLLQQVDRTNKVLEELTKPNWFQRTVLGKK